MPPEQSRCSHIRAFKISKNCRYLTVCKQSAHREDESDESDHEEIEHQPDEDWVGSYGRTRALREEVRDDDGRRYKQYHGEEHPGDPVDPHL